VRKLRNIAGIESSKKHEGPEYWRYRIQEGWVEFLTIEGFDVLLPVDKENHPNITIDRCIVSADGETLTIFLHDRTHSTDPDWDMFAGRLAVCEKVPEHEWFIAIVYHECWVSEFKSPD
jgi:hypothetical protein